MGQLAFENDVLLRLQGKHHLQPVFSGGGYGMGSRIREYDPALFIVWNTKRQRYEVHSLNHPVGSTYAATVPYTRLDARLEEVIRRGDLRIRGKAVFQEINDHNERLERGAERSRLNDLMGIAEEMHPYFKPLGWEGI